MESETGERREYGRFLHSVKVLRLSGYAYNYQNTTKHPPDFFFDFRLGHTTTKIPIFTNTINTDIDLFTNEVYYLLMKFAIKRNLPMANI